MAKKKDIIFKRETEVKHSYKILRNLKFRGELYKKGQQIGFLDKNIEKLFIHNNYVI